MSRTEDLRKSVTLPIFRRSFVSASTAMVVSSLLLSHGAWAKPSKYASSPRLVVMIVVDQMRADLLERFAAAMQRASNGRAEGFLRMRAEGVLFSNAKTASAPTVTAAGHAALCTGAQARVHGIVGNSFFDRSLQRDIEATFDPTAQTVVTAGLTGKDPLSQVNDEGSSARLRKVPSLADVFHEASKGRARTVSMSIKDRGAVFCSGQSSVGTYWYDYKTGSMVSSRAFTRQLPGWVNTFNQKHADRKLVSWKPLFSLSEMQSLLADSKLRSALTVRSALSNRYGTGFPYESPANDTQGLGARNFFQFTPAAHDYLVEFALAAVHSERLGCAARESDKPCEPANFPDLLTVSFSTTDLVGHTFGGESPELMDTFLQLNKSVEQLMTQLEQKLGRGQVLFVLSADHGVQPLPEVLQARGEKVERLTKDAVIAAVESELTKRFGPGPWVETISTGELYFKEKTVQERKVKSSELIKVARAALIQLPGVRAVLSEEDLRNPRTAEAKLYARGHDSSRSGDLKILTQPGWLWGNYNAANHGTAYDDDTRIPLIFSGWKIAKPGVRSREVYADDVAPSILALLGVKPPPFMTGRVLSPERRH